MLQRLGKPDALEMRDECKHIALRIAKRIEPSLPLMGQDDDFRCPSVFDRAPCAFLGVDRKSRRLKHSDA